MALQIDTSRFLLRDFEQTDLTAFLGYQTDPRYRRLFDLNRGHARQAADLFSLFLSWQREEPRRNYQLGIFERSTGRLCGSAGLRRTGSGERHGTLGIELAPGDWGRYRPAVEVAGAVVEVGFRDLGLDAVRGSTASGNKRIERLARWFGAEIISRRAGAGWMAARGWAEVEWALPRSYWESTKRGAAEDVHEGPGAPLRPNSGRGDAKPARRSTS